jgi:tetratricopeptide (TPR) repeat protein/SAM-dependent methyltransferase
MYIPSIFIIIVNNLMIMDDGSTQFIALKIQGARLIDANRLDEAIILFTELVHRYPENAEALYLLSSINGRLGRFDDAEVFARRAVALRPDYGDAHLNLASVLFRKGLHVEALEKYRLVLQLAPGNANAHFNIGQIQSTLGNYDEAVESYRAALCISPMDSYINAIKQQAFALMRIDCLDAAGKLLKLIGDARSNDVEIWRTLGTINGILGNMDQAAQCCHRVLAVQPDNSDALVTLGHVRMQQGRLDEAVDLYAKALEANPLSIGALNSLSRSCTTQDQFDKYIAAYLNAVTALPDPTAVRTAFIKAIERRIPASYEPWLDTELNACFSMQGINYDPLALVTANTLKYKYNISADGVDRDDAALVTIRPMADDRLLISLLEKTINIDPELEGLLTKVRRTLLNKHHRGDSLEEWEHQLMTILAYQAFNNEYVFDTDDEEDRQLAELKDSIERTAASIDIPNDNLEIGMSAYAMYDSLPRLACREHLAGIPIAKWSVEFRPLVVETLLHPMEEEDIMAGIESISAIRDPTSQLVQSQYEENPYPRWLVLPEIQHVNLRHFLKQEYMHLSPPAFLDGPLRILVAGCGTGRQPIQTSLYYKMHHDVQITAVDLSRRSLAYAVRMARGYGVDNINFLHGDILELSRLKERFHIIECQGVLHHMEHPERGWKVLSDLLVDDGLMWIGLYSKTARANLDPLQELFKLEALTPTNRNVRHFRYRIMHGALGDYRFHGQDFYSTSGCRDLLCHYMEHEYTPLQLDSMMRELNLKFIGFTLRDVNIKHLYHRHYPEDPDMTNLVLWEQFESLYPHTFSKMLQFWCQRQSHPY